MTSIDGDTDGYMTGGKGNTIEEDLIGIESSDTAGNIEDLTNEG